MHTPYAHTLPEKHKKHWEPLFTPFGKVDPADPTQACSGKNAAPCPHCQNLDPTHGHLNKVAHLASQFAAEMFPLGPDRDAAQQWAYLTGLWHDPRPASGVSSQHLPYRSQLAHRSLSGRIRAKKQRPRSVW